MLVINRDNLEGKWFKYDGDEEVQFKIKPFKLSLRNVRPGDDLTSVIIRTGKYCITDWKGIQDVNGTVVPFNEQNKEFLLDHMEELAVWVAGKSSEMNKEIVNIKKK